MRSIRRGRRIFFRFSRDVRVMELGQGRVSWFNWYGLRVYSLGLVVDLLFGL